MNTFTRIGLGTWEMEKNPKEAVRALRAGLEEGVNHIDTAEMYGDGRAEEIVAEAVQGAREKIHIVSKVLPSNAGYATTIRACERSLKRLRTNYLDIYLLHWREEDTPLEETFRAFETLKKDGKIRAWGVSNFDVEDLEEVVEIVGKPSVKEGKFVCNQVYYSIKERAVELKVLPWCRENGVRLVAYSPLGQGRLPTHSALNKVADELKCTPAQVALAFLIQDENVIAIPKSSDEQRARENARAMQLKLSAAQLDVLNEAFPAKARSSLPMV